MDCGEFSLSLYSKLIEMGFLLLKGEVDFSDLFLYFSLSLSFWGQVDYTVVFAFRLLMFVDNGLAAGMGL